METYSSKPFVSHDGEDANGVRAEVNVIKGVGKPYVKHAGEKAINYAFSVENTKYDPAAWIPKDEKANKVIEKAIEDDEPVEFRIEIRRKKTIDRTTPISELTPLAVAKESIDRSLAAVKPLDDEEMTFSSKAVTDPIEDPSDNGSGLISALGKVDAPARKSRPVSNNGGGFREAPPYMVRNDDGSLNAGCYSVGAISNIYFFVLEQASSSEFFDLEQGGEKADQRLALRILKICNNLQMEIYGEERMPKPDPNASSHTRARAIVFETIKKSFPMTDELHDKKNLESWADNVFDSALEIWKWSMKISNAIDKK